MLNQWWSTVRGQRRHSPLRRERAAVETALLRLAGPALALAIWVVGVFAPRQPGVSDADLMRFSLALLGLAGLDLSAPGRDGATARRLCWLALELAGAFMVIELYGSFRPALVYLIPAVRALILFGGATGLLLSLSAWLAYSGNVLWSLWPRDLHEYPNYLWSLLTPYVLSVVLTDAILRQAVGRRHLQRLYDELQAAHAELRQLHQTVRASAVAAERNRLAREIHDTLAHYLTVINVQLEAAEKLGDGQPDPAIEQVRRARRLTLHCLSEVRRSVAALRAESIADLALPGALRRLAAEFSENTGIAVTVELDLADDVALPAETALAVYRIAQEGLTNIYRHAKATAARISLTEGGGQLEFSLEDDGVGPPPASEGGHGGFGLLGLQERVELLGGRLTFAGVSSGGSRLAVMLPREGDAP